ncbi:MAG: ATP-dependent DNA helicase RecQ [Planctomycetes bacterium]|nr:ATP-dependent DNA helicase RecQ [Planctomycetota bacterium]
MTVHRRDTLVLASTATGKTLVYAASGVLLGGIILVVEPLNSLIRDQVRRFKEWELPVLAWNGDVSKPEKAEIRTQIRAGRWGFFFTTPESLSAKSLRDLLQGKVKLAVIDEAHTALRDRGFRAQYGRLGFMLDYLEPQVRLVCTATCPSPDRQELIRVLGLRQPSIVTASTMRKNIGIRIVERSHGALARILNSHAGTSGLIFVSTIRTATALCSALRVAGRNAGIFHGQLPPAQKISIQDAFMANKLPIVVATDAFLLGIDKADIRFCVHYDPPKSVEDWVQGVGRCGRDGKESHAYGCFGVGAAEGFDARRYLIRSSFPAVEDLRKVWEWIRNSSEGYCDYPPAKIAKIVLGERAKHSAQPIISILQQNVLIEVTPLQNGQLRHAAFGDFGDFPLDRYEAEKVDAFARLTKLREVCSLPDAEIPGAIDKYFEGAESNP